jgi:hypothetical protein
MLLAFLPGFGEFDPVDLDKNSETIRGALSTASADRMRTVGALLAVRGFVDYFLASRSSRDSWDKTLASIAIVRQKRVQEGADAEALELFDKLQRELPFRREQWLAVVEKWNALRAAELSDDSLTSWWSVTGPRS